MKLHIGNGPFEYQLPAIKWNDPLILPKDKYSEFKNIPENLTDINRGRIYFDIRQYIFQSYIAGKISKIDFEKIKNSSRIKLNENSLVKKSIKCFVNIISGKNEEGKLVYMIDANNNYDFSDDSIFIPLSDTLSDEELNKHLVKVVCQKVLNGKIVNDTATLLIAKDGSALGFSISEYATASLNINGEKIRFAVSPLFFMSRTWTECQLVILTGKLKIKNEKQYEIFNNGDFLTIGRNTYKFNGVNISKNSLLLQKISDNKQQSAQLGFHAPLFESENLLTGKPVSLASLKGKFVLLNFWGTWCQPCREELPDLRSIYSATDTSRLIFINIASNDSVKNLKAVISQEHMTWPQLFSDAITLKYNVNSFPTSYLISPNGIIVEKNLSITDLKEKLSRFRLIK